MELDRQAIERRDFPIGRRGYDPDAVDAHLRALAGEFEELQRVAAGGGPDVSLASAAGSHVHSILAAAETAAAEIERGAQESAHELREAAERDAEHTREEALERARAHVAAVGQAAAALLERVGSMDGEVGALVDSLRAGASRLASDLSAVESGMRDLYEASSGRTIEEPHAPAEREQPGAFASELEEALAGPPPAPAAPAPPAPHEGPRIAARVDLAAPEGEGTEEAGGDLDGARLVALNMALNGESRAETERYLAENFQLPDRLKLIDEVYAAIEE
jgi:DivIVA domain-containing protein